MSEKVVFIRGRRLTLRPVLEEDFGERYLRWLNDPEVNEHSQRRVAPMGEGAMRAYPRHYDENPDKGVVLAVVAEGAGHIGNISLVDVESVNRCANLAILIGEKEQWGKGYAAEAIHLLTRHAFREMNLHKLVAATVNPAFAACVERLGWKREGVQRERVWRDGGWHDMMWFSILAHEFKDKEEFLPLS